MSKISPNCSAKECAFLTHCCKRRHRIRSDHRTEHRRANKNSRQLKKDKMSLESRQRDLNFLQKLWDAATCNEDGRIYWSSKGNSIIFRFDFLKKYCPPNGNPLCNTKSLSSFIRILNSYGFRKVRNSKRDLHGKPSATLYLQYSREFFQKGRADLLSLIERRQAKRRIEGTRRKKDAVQKTKLTYREKVVKYRLESVDAARKNFKTVIAKSLKAYKNGDKDNFLQKSMTVEGITKLCEETRDTIVRVASRVVVMKVQQNEDPNVLSLVEVPKHEKKLHRLVGEWNAVPIVKQEAPPCAVKEEVIEYEEKS